MASSDFQVSPRDDGEQRSRTNLELSADGRSPVVETGLAPDHRKGPRSTRKGIRKVPVTRGSGVSAPEKRKRGKKEEPKVTSPDISLSSSFESDHSSDESDRQVHDLPAAGGSSESSVSRARSSRKPPAQKMRKGRDGRRERVVARAVADEIQQLQGENDALRALAPQKPPVYKNGHPVLDQVLKPFYDGGGRFGTVIGTGAWFNLWNAGCVFEQFVKRGDDAVLLVAAVPDSRGRGAFNWWLGPSFYACPTQIPDYEEGCLLGIWDQKLTLLDEEDLEAWTPVLAYDDITLYQRGGHQVHVEERWRYIEVEASKQDFYGVLVSSVAPVLWGLVDTWGIRSYQSKNNAYTVESLRAQIFAQNKMFVWAGHVFCPPELMIGMVVKAQDDTHRAYTSSMLSGQFWRTAPMNFINSMPSRLVNLGVGAFGLARATTDFVSDVVADQVASALAPSDEPEPHDGDDQDLPPPLSSGDLPVERQEREELGDLFADATSRSASNFQSLRDNISDITRGITRGFTFGIGLPSFEGPSCGVIATPLGWEDKNVFSEAFTASRSLSADVEVTTELGFFCFERANFVKEASLGYVDIERYEEFPSFENPRRGISWKKTRTLERREPKGKFYGLWEFGWPLYSPCQSPLMTFCTILIRLGPEPAYEPLGFKTPFPEGVCVNGFYDNIAHVMGDLPTYFVAPSGSLLLPSDASVAGSSVAGQGQTWCANVAHFLETDTSSLTDATVRDMTRNMKSASVRVGQYLSSTIVDLVPMADQIDCFTKTDEILVAAKPRLIHNVPAKDFWEMRDHLRNFGNLLAAVWFLIFDMDDMRMTFTYGGAMNPEDKSRWRQEAARHSHEEKNNFHVLVGGDDILILCEVEGELWEIELDVSRCDQSQSNLSFAVFSLMYRTITRRSDRKFLERVRANLQASTTYYRQTGFALETGMGETTVYNSCTIGGTALLALLAGCYTSESIRLFYNVFGYDVKVSQLKQGCGTFHKGFWVEEDGYWTWMPLPSRFCKFGWREREESQTIDVIDHLSRVARGWRSMRLDPVFFAFVEKFPLVEQAEVPNEFGLARAWQNWDWGRLAKQPCTISPAMERFFCERYAFQSGELSGLVEWITNDIPLETARVRNPSLKKIFLRDYACDTSEEFQVLLQ